jgi:hypothetical protein
MEAGIVSVGKSDLVGIFAQRRRRAGGNLARDRSLAGFFSPERRRHDRQQYRGERIFHLRD